jgi:hypothetical protein
MAIISCSNCGADIDHTARFCRLCGQAINQAEAQTARMPIPDQFGAATQGFDPSPTFPTYGMPQTMPAAAAPDTQPIEKRRHKRLFVIALSLIAFFIVAIAGLGVALTFWGRPSHRARGFPPPPAAPRHPPIPQSEDQPAIIRGLMYPDARVILNMVARNGSSVIQLYTADPIDRVARWYEVRIQPNTKKIVPGESVMFDAENVKVLIQNEGHGTQIFITNSPD